MTVAPLSSAAIGLAVLNYGAERAQPARLAELRTADVEPAAGKDSTARPPAVVVDLSAIAHAAAEAVAATPEADDGEYREVWDVGGFLRQQLRNFEHGYSDLLQNLADTRAALERTEQTGLLSWQNPDGTWVMREVTPERYQASVEAMKARLTNPEEKIASKLASIEDTRALLARYEGRRQSAAPASATGGGGR